MNIKLKDLLQERDPYDWFCKVPSKKCIVKDKWGRSATSKWYGFDPHTKKYTIGKNKGKTYAEVMKAASTWPNRLVKSVTDWIDEIQRNLYACVDETIENIKTKGIKWFHKNEGMLLALYKLLNLRLSQPLSELRAIIRVHTAIWGEGGKIIRLIFPGGNDWENETVSLFQNVGVITAPYKSVPNAIAAVNALANKGVKATELIIGSHGDGDLLVMPADYNYSYNDDFMYACKNIVTPRTKVFFTACYGAKHLYTLVKAANQLGVNRVYGASGIYNPATNTAENGFYYCQSVSETRLKSLAKKSKTNNYKSNKFLIKSRIAKKISGSPISWLQSV